MNTFKHVILTILIFLAIGIQGIIANDTYANGPPHLKILVFKFGGTAHVDRKDKFDEFIDAICRAIDELRVDFLYMNSKYAFLSDLKYEDFGSFDAPRTDKARKGFYENVRALEIHTGLVGFEKDTVYVIDNIFLINKLAKTPSPIRLKYNILAEEYNSLKNIQQAVMCYALAMDAKRIKKDTDIISGFLSNGFNLLSNIDSGKLPFAKLLKEAIEKDLAILKSSK